MIGLGLHINKSLPIVYTGPLLDKYSGAIAAYSLRELSSNWENQAVVRVRRSSDNAELDFTATEIADGTLVSWAGTTAYVVKFYNQGTGGASFDLIQSSAEPQPLIVFNSALVGGIPSIFFDGSSDYLETATTVTKTGRYWTAIGVFRFSTLSGTQQIFNQSDGGDIDASRPAEYIRSDYPSAPIRLGAFDGAGSFSYTSPPSSISYTTGVWYLTFNDINSNSLQTNVNGVKGPLKNLDITPIDGGNAQLALGADNRGISEFHGYVTEIILYNTSQKSLEDDITASINAYYSIY